MSSELKSCPFCGHRLNDEAVFADEDIYWVDCPNCYANTPYAETYQEAVSFWDLRIELTLPLEGEAYYWLQDLSDMYEVPMRILEYKIERGDIRAVSIMQKTGSRWYAVPERELIKIEYLLHPSLKEKDYE